MRFGNRSGLALKRGLIITLLILNFNKGFSQQNRSSIMSDTIGTTNFYETTNVEGRNHLEYTGTKPLYESLKEMKFQEVMSTLSGEAPNFKGQWEFIGPDSVTYLGWIGRLNKVAFYEKDTQHIYVGSAFGGGLWRSTDEGITWEPLSDGIPVTGVSGIAVHPESSDTMYILIGDGENGKTRGLGVLRSDNAGETWQLTGLGWNVENPGPRGFDLKMFPGHPDTLFACTEGGLYRTLDKGNSWSRVVSSKCTDVEFKPNNPNVVYASSGDTLFRSINAGNTWTKVSGYFNGSHRMELAVTKAESNLVYVLTGKNDQYEGIYLSRDSGATFQKKYNGNIWIDGQTNNNLSIAASPTDAGMIYAGAQKFALSQDSGKSWWPSGFIVNAPLHVDIHDFQFNANTLYCANDGGLNKLPYGQKSWIDLSTGLQISTVEGIGGTPQNDTILYAGFQDNAFANRIVGLKYNSITNPLGDGQDVVINHRNEDTLYAYIQPQNVSELIKTPNLYRSVNGGNDWNRLTIDTAKNPVWRLPFSMDMKNPLKLYAACGNGIYKSNDAGNSWANLHPSSQKKWASIGLCENDSNYIYVVSHFSAEMSDDGGQTWNDISSGLLIDANKSGDTSLQHILVSPVDPLRAWVCIWSPSETVIMKTSNGGQSWQDVSGSLPNIAFGTLAYQKGSDNGIYAGSETGVYYINDSLYDWVRFMNGLPNVNIHDFDIHHPTRSIRTGTYGRGIWESPLYCKDKYLLSSTSVGEKYYEVSDSILSSSTLNSGSEDSIIYTAGNKIRLLPGFKASSGNNFHGFIKGCECPTELSVSGILDGAISAPPGFMRDVLFVTEPSCNQQRSLDEFLVYPTPSSGKLKAKVNLSSEQNVNLVLINQEGKIVGDMYTGELSKGLHKFQWNETEDLSSGLYYVVLKSNYQLISREWMLIR